MSKRISKNDVVRVLLICIIYFLAHRIAFFFPDSVKVLMSIWPPGGVGLAALLLSPRRLWPMILLSLFITGNLANLLEQRPVVAGVGFMLANITESLACAWWIQRCCGEKIEFKRVSEIIALLASATIINAGTALMGAFAASLTGRGSFWGFWFSWYIADGLGILLITPLLLTLYHRLSQKHEFNGGQVAEWVFFLILWCIVAQMTFPSGNVLYPFFFKPYILVAILVWPALRLGQLTMTVSLLILSVFVLTGKTVLVTPSPWIMLDSVLAGQVYIFVTAFSGLILAASFAEVKTKEKQVLDSEARYRDVIETTDDLILRTDKQGRLVFANMTSQKYLGGSPANCVGFYLWDFVHPEDASCLRDLFSTWLNGVADPGSLEVRQLQVDGIVRNMLYKASRVNSKEGQHEISIIARDITDRKVMEEERFRMSTQLMQTQKLEALGTLAGGIAHDFNNLLAAIFGYIDLARERSNDKNVTTWLEKAMGTLGRSRALTRQILTFAKGGAPVCTLGAIGPLIQETAQCALRGSNLVSRIDLDPLLMLCNFDQSQLSQVIDNLVINASQSMPDGGRLEIKATNELLLPDNEFGLNAGPYIKVQVSDSGCGIDKDILPRIFDPFFSTKKQGSGLGLSICYSIIKKHEGTMKVETIVGQGSSFSFYLPAIPGTILSEVQQKEQMPIFSGNVLIMDDEEVVRDSLEGLLRSIGLNVIAVNEGSAVISLLERNPEAYNVIILDLTVPGGMGGVETIAKIRCLNQHVPVYIISGYSEDTRMVQPEVYGFAGSLQKPFTRSEIINMLRKYLEHV